MASMEPNPSVVSKSKKTLAALLGFVLMATAVAFLACTALHVRQAEAAGPIVTFVTPTNGSTATGTITLEASSSEPGTTIASVQFQVDGTNAGSAVTSTNNLFSESLDTAAYSATAHTLTAIATDASGTTSTVSISVTFANNYTVWTYQGGGLNSGWIYASYGTNTSTYGNTAYVYPGSTSSLEDVFSSGDLGLVNTATNELYPQNYNSLQFAVYTTSTPFSFTVNLGGYFGGDATSGPTVSLGNVIPNQWNLFEVPMSQLEPNNYAFRGIYFGPSGPATFYVDSIGLMGKVSDSALATNITAPASNSVVSSTIPFAATATGTLAIQNVQLFASGTSVGIATSSPYSFSWNTGDLHNGTTTLEAIATDINGNQASTTETVTIDNVDTTPPTVAITSPANGAFASGTVALVATSTDNVAVQDVQFELNGSPLGSAITVPPYTYSWDTLGYTNATDTITAVSTDTSGNQASSSITVYVDNPPDSTPPQVVITSPANNSAVSSTITITASSTDNVAVQNVQFQANGVDLGSAVTSTNDIYSTTVNTNLYPNGTSTLTITAVSTDTSGNQASSSVSLSVYNNVTAWIYQGGALNSGWAQTGYGTATTTYNNTTEVYPGSTSSVEDNYTTGVLGLTNNTANSLHYPDNYNDLQFAVYTAASSFSLGVNLGSDFGQATSGPVATVNVTPDQWNLVSLPMSTLEPNGYLFDSIFIAPSEPAVFYLDAIGLMAKTDITPPNVAFTSPVSGASVSSTITIAATSTDNVAVKDVQFQIDGADFGGAVTSTPYAISWNTLDDQNGAYTLTAISTDTSGNTSSTSETVTVANPPDTTPPQVAITSPASGASLTGIVTLTASSTDNRAVKNVQFQVNGADAGSALTSSSSIYSTTLNTTFYSNGTTTITAISTDTSGNQASSSVTVGIDNNAAVVTLVDATSTCFGTTGCTESSYATSSALSFPGGVQGKGDLLVAWTDWYDYEPTSTIADSAGNQWVPIYAGQFTNGNDLYSAWYTLATSTGADTVTANFPTGEFGTFGIAEFHAPAITATSALDSFGVNLSVNASTTDLIATTTASVTAPNELIVGLAGSANYSGTYTAGSGFTVPSGGSTSGSTKASAALEWMTTSTASGIASATMTTTVPNAGIAVIAFRTDTVPPIVSLTAPVNDATVSSTISLSAAASDNVGVRSVQFEVDGQKMGAPLASAPYSTAWVTGESTNGMHTITALATDVDGNTASSSIIVNLNNPTNTIPPAVSFVDVATSSVSGTSTITVAASDAVGVQSVEFEANGFPIATVTSTPYSVQWNTYNTFDGPNTITAIATDYAGNTATATATITVQNTIPLAPGQKWVSAYYATWLEGNQYNGWLRPWQIDYGAFTNEDFFGTNFTATGTVDALDSWGAPEAVYWAHLNGRKIFLTAGAAYSGTAFDSAASPTYRTTFINNLVNEMAQYGFDGLDLDIEPITQTDNNFAEFIPLLKAAMQKVNPDAELTLAQDGTVPTSTLPYFNEINIMTYDMTYPFGGGWVSWFNSPLHDGGLTFASTGGLLPSINVDVNQDASSGIPLSQIGIGVEFYGMTWNGGSICAPLQPFDGSSSTVKLDVPDYTLMNEYPTSTLLYDTTADESYASNCAASSSPSNYFISYDDEQSIAAKASYIQSKGIGGMIIFELGGGYLSTSTVAIKDPFLRAVGADMIIGTSTASTTVASISAPSSLTVSNGTAFGSLALPSSVNTNLANGTVMSLPVTWSGSGYTGSPGTYALSGNLTNLPAIVTNPSSVTPTIHVTVASSSIYSIESVIQPAAESVTEGTAYSDLNLPATVEVSLSNGSFATVDVNWAQGSYNMNADGTYYLTGTLTNLPVDVSNPNYASAFLSVQVGSSGGSSGGTTPTVYTGGGGGAYVPYLTPSGPIYVTPGTIPPSTSNSSAPVSSVTPPVTQILGYRERGAEVKDLQSFLASMGVFPRSFETGYFGPLTMKAVQEFQCKEGIVCKGGPGTTGWGHVGPETLAAIKKVASQTSTQTQTTTPSTPGPVSVSLPTGGTITQYLARTEQSPEVQDLQKFLVSQNIFPADLTTGYFGTITMHAVQTFQCQQKIVCDGGPGTTGWGHVGPATLAKIEEMTSSLNASSTSSGQ